MKAAMLAHDILLAGTNDILVARGMESMTNAPYLLPKARGGLRHGHSQLIDHMSFDGVEDAYFDRGRLMGTFAEERANKYKFSRQEQNAYATASTTRAQHAIQASAFSWEIAPITVSGRSGSLVIAQEEQPPKARIEKFPNLKPAFKKDGTVTPTNSSSISDGAVALVLMRRSTAEKLGVSLIAIVHGHAKHAQEPAIFTTAPVGATQKVLARVNWSVDDIDLWEINEAFSVVSMAAMRDLGLDHGKVNYLWWILCAWPSYCSFRSPHLSDFDRRTLRYRWQTRYSQLVYSRGRSNRHCDTYGVMKLIRFLLTFRHGNNICIGASMAMTSYGYLRVKNRSFTRYLFIDVVLLE